MKDKGRIFLVALLLVSIGIAIYFYKTNEIYRMQKGKIAITKVIFIMPGDKLKDKIVSNKPDVWKNIKLEKELPDEDNQTDNDKLYIVNYELVIANGKKFLSYKYEHKNRREIEKLKKSDLSIIDTTLPGYSK